MSTAGTTASAATRFHRPPRKSRKYAHATRNIAQSAAVHIKSSTMAALSPSWVAPKKRGADGAPRSRARPSRRGRFEAVTCAATLLVGDTLRRDATLVFVRARVDLDSIPGLAERRNLHQVPRRELGGLQHLARRVAADRGLGVHHL